MKKKYSYFLILIVYEAYTFVVDKEKIEFCARLNCENTRDRIVCGLRQEGDGFRLKTFQSECELMKFGCRVEEKDAYGLINLVYCKKSFPNLFNNAYNDKSDAINTIEINITTDKDLCATECSTKDLNAVCGIRRDGPGFKVRWFQNYCDLTKYNCLNTLRFNATYSNLCRDNLSEHNILSEHNNLSEHNKRKESTLTGNTNTRIEEINQLNDTTFETDETETKTEEEVTTALSDVIPEENLHKNLVVLDGSMLDYNGNINETMDNFFSMTHVFDLPIKDVDKDFSEKALNEEARRMLINVFKPVKVYKPWIEIPKNINTDHWHQPTLSSCYHKCPTRCPDTYAPVCGVPGVVAREPSLMFKNHCFMDVAQCKMRWEDRSDTAVSSSYIESSFLICLGDALNGLYRFLPLVRTLQHMGRLRKKGKFRYKMRNMGFFNQLLSRDPKVMG